MTFSEDEVRRAAEAHEDFTRRLRHCDFLRLWRGCADAACRRAHACAGAPGLCFQLAYAQMSDTARLWADAGLAALDHGASRRAAAQAADRRLLSHLREQERLPRYFQRRRLWRWVKAEEGGDRDSQPPA